jgi:hypothetical protein
MGTVVISSVTFDIYGTQTGGGGSVEYLTASSTEAATAYLAATPDAQARALVSVARLLNRQRWQGLKTLDAQPLAWPRTSVADSYGNVVDSLSIPVDVINASYELAAMVIADPSLLDKASTAENISSLQAGSVSISFFRREGGARFPTIVEELIGAYLSSSASGGGSSDSLYGIASGTGVESQFDDDDILGVTL